MAKSDKQTATAAASTGLTKKLVKGFENTPLHNQSVTLPAIPASVADAVASGKFDSEQTILRAAYSALHGRAVNAVKLALTRKEAPITDVAGAQSVVDSYTMSGTRARSGGGENQSLKKRQAATEKALASGALAAISSDALRAMAATGAISTEFAEAEIAKRG